MIILDEWKIRPIVTIDILISAQLMIRAMAEITWYGERTVVIKSMLMDRKDIYHIIREESVGDG